MIRDADDAALRKEGKVPGKFLLQIGKPGLPGDTMAAAVLIEITPLPRFNAGLLGALLWAIADGRLAAAVLAAGGIARRDRAIARAHVLRDHRDVHVGEPARQRRQRACLQPPLEFRLGAVLRNQGLSLSGLHPAAPRPHRRPAASRCAGTRSRRGRW